MPLMSRLRIITKSRTWSLHEQNGAPRNSPIISTVGVRPLFVRDMYFIGELGITRYKVAKLTSAQRRRNYEICSGKRAITSDTALRLARLFGADAALWMNLPAQYDLEISMLPVGR